MEQRLTVSENLNATFVQLVRRDKIYVLVRLVVALSPALRQTRVAADCEPSACCAVVATGVEWTATRLDDDKGNQKRRRRRARKTCASKVVCLAVGQHVKGMLARSTLRPQHGLRTVWQSWPDCYIDELSVQKLRRPILPPTLRIGWVPHLA